MIATLAFLLAFFNGANDSGKGVATLACSGESRPRGALRWAVLTTLAGALAAVWGGAALAATFSGKGLVPDAVAGTPSFLLAAGAGAVVTVALATALRLPVSTSHALLGGLLGSALGGGVAVDGGALATKFLLPLAFSPLLAALLGAGAAVAGRRLAAARDGRSDAALGIQPGGAAGSGRLLHWVSAGLTSFARGFHDAPKITAVLLAVPALSAATGAAGVALAMAAGGWLLGRGVTRRVSTELAACRPEEGCGANLVTSALVLAASPLGLPVSTTHVSCGAVAGAGLVAERFDRRLFGGFVLAWLVTLPLGAGAAAAARLLV